MRVYLCPSLSSQVERMAEPAKTRHEEVQARFLAQQVRHQDVLGAGLYGGWITDEQNGRERASLTASGGPPSAKEGVESS